MRPLLAAVGALALLAACNSSSPPAVLLDGSPRVPDVEGVVQKASKAGITLDGNRKFTVSDKLISFSTYNQRVVPVGSTVGKYVQLGVDDGQAKWLALIGVVSTDETAGGETVRYQGELTKVVGHRFEFKDGTVLRLASNLTAPDDPLGLTYVVIDAKRRVIQGATFQDRAATTTTRAKKS